MNANVLFAGNMHVLACTFSASINFISRFDFAQ